MVRRIGAAGTPEALALLVKGLSEANDDGTRLTILRGLGEALKGRRQVPMPETCPQVFARLAEGVPHCVPNLFQHVTSRSVAI